MYNALKGSLKLTTVDEPLPYRWPSVIASVTLPDEALSAHRRQDRVYVTLGNTANHPTERI